MAPDIDIFGLTISEPVTTATDYLVTAVGWWLGARLLRGGQARGGPLQLWGVAFLWIGLAAFLGGTSHGFARYLGDAGSFFIWKATVYSIGLSATFALAGSIASAAVSQSSRRRLHGLNIVAFLVYGGWMINHGGFIYVIYHYVPAMTAIAVLQIVAWSKTRSTSAPWIVAGVMTTMAGAVVQQSGIALQIHFNHNDIYHLIQVVGLVLFYRGVVSLKAQQSRDPDATPA